MVPLPAVDQAFTIDLQRSDDADGNGNVADDILATNTVDERVVQMLVG